jgi:cyclase
MLKTRVLPTLLYKDTGLVKGVGFDSNRRVGPPLQAVKVYNMREVDELIFLDITATTQKRTPDLFLIEDMALECFMPMTVGGGVRCVQDIADLLGAGADKVAINTAAVECPEVIKEGADRFGVQCIVVSIDARRVGKGWEVLTHGGTQPTGMDPVDLARRVVMLGAGEILITSIDQDGTMGGYDLALTAAVSEAVNVPVIASGGAGNADHMVDVLRGSKAAAVAAASIFHFTEQTPKDIKRRLREEGIPVRL